ncbi:hypothetical protein [Methylobacterium gnaphalii]|uniref:hypothetical protein n=1 Tax=Methylobacterium gnaphalii TaxID=1010610 RepID=UPI00207E59D3|nr:hypothetical protein [Methylobacterium gnaphalii]GJD70563.1 hypothetical protein MMMDOFMJ_3512 [Methylobacterium gnaphalii]GLS48517.1 hypothetical protein GCM10007885_13610 [Methylobacterium gnaphalii]
MEGRSAGFFCYGNEGGNELDDDRRPRILKQKDWFNPSDEPYQGDERKAYQSLVWQCRYSGIEVPDDLWRHASVGLGRPYADDQADDMAQETRAMACFDTWVEAFVGHVTRKGVVPGTTEAERGAQSTT